MNRLLHLPSAERHLLINTAALLALVRLGLLLLPFAVVRRLLANIARPAKRMPDLRPSVTDRVPWAIGVASRYVPGATCLTQALAGQTLLARYGQAGQLRIGVARAAGGRLQAHAWIEIQGQIVVGQIEGFDDFTVLSAFGRAQR